jgi:uncharacterized damage-inducible protein DinB
MCADMFIDLDDDPRPDPDPRGDERTTLVEFLRWQRGTLELKCVDLTPEQLAIRSVDPSSMSLLGLIRHMADVEQGWFRQVMAGQQVTAHFETDEDREAAWEGAVPTQECVDEAWRLWREEVAFAEKFVDEAADLDVLSAKDDAWRGPMSLRWILVHMIEEYARHNGHADFLRERIDGRVGQ